MMIQQPSAVSKPAYYDTHPIRRDIADHYYRKLGPAKTILDVGCGTGDFGRHCPPGVELHGVDHDERAIALARRYEIAHRVDLETESLPYPCGRFDAVLARDIFEHLQGPTRLAAEVHRVLRPGGLLLVSVVMARPKRVWADYTHVRGYTKKSVQLFLTDCGFRVQAVWPMGGVPLSARLRLTRYVPLLLRMPGFNQLWASSWEALAHREP